MKIKTFSAVAVALLLTTGAYAQETNKEMRKEARAERNARLKEDLKVAGEAVDTTAARIGRGVNKGLDKAENAITSEADKIKAKRRAAKARRDTL